MLFYAIVLLFYSGIGALVLFGIFRKTTKNESPQYVAKTRKVMQAIFVGGILSYVFVVGVSQNHFAKGELLHDISFHLHGWNQPSFLDNPVDLTLTIQDVITGKRFSYEFHSVDGPGIRFLQSDSEPQIIYVHTTGRPLYTQGWKIDLEKDELDTAPAGPMVALPTGFVEVYHIGDDMEVVYAVEDDKLKS